MQKLKRASSSSSSSSSRSSSPINYGVEILDELFDIASCKCLRLLNNIEDIHKYNCKCVQKKRIPDIAIPFYIDQRTSRNLLISSIGRKECENELDNDNLSRDLSAIATSDSDTTDIHTLDQNALNKNTSLHSSSSANYNDLATYNENLSRDLSAIAVCDSKATGNCRLYQSTPNNNENLSQCSSSSSSAYNDNVASSIAMRVPAHL